MNEPAFFVGIVQCTMNDQPRSKEEENQQAEEPKSDTGKGQRKSEKSYTNQLRYYVVR